MVSVEEEEEENTWGRKKENYKRTNTNGQIRVEHLEQMHLKKGLKQDQ
jgi:hypothetical protein